MFVSFTTKAAQPDRENEDFFAATANVAVLLDGTGTSADAEDGCSHGVAWFARQLGVRCLEAATTGADPLTDVLRSALKQVIALHEHSCDLNHPDSPSSAVIILREHRDGFEYLVLAGSVLVARGRSGNQAITDDREATYAQQYRPLLAVLSQTGKTHDVAARTYVEMMREHRNRQGGFWVASADPDAASHARTGVLGVDEAQIIALLSSGASRPVDTFDLLNWDYAIEELAAGGPKQWLKRVRRAEQEDPHAQRWPRARIHDDATAAIVVPDWA